MLVPLSSPQATLPLLLLLLLSALLLSPSGASSDIRQQPVVCFIVRTYWGHGDLFGDGSLRKLLAALQRQEEHVRCVVNWNCSSLDSAAPPVRLAC